LGMGQRADVVFTMPASGAVRLVDTAQQGTPSPFERLFNAIGANVPRTAHTVTLGGGPAPEATADLNTLPLFDFTTYGAPAADPMASRTDFDATYDLRLGKHPGFRDGRPELIHTINGQASPNISNLVVQ